ncbi:uncharacterized protein [Drosophila virilis]|uniref:uncharacterized protein n=1 Tax=Drosophila virilis TaxID=7244 RepID=UPI0013965300|nr:uncharacterized protein LOC116652034 [Drosophila virilis]
MGCVKVLILLTAIIYCLRHQVAAVTCDVAPLDPNCVSCILNPTNTECITSTTTATTTAATVISTTKKSRRRRIRTLLSSFFQRIQQRFQQIKNKLNPIIP